MSLAEMLNNNDLQDNQQLLITPERIKNSINDIRELIRFYRWYPDIFIDDMKGPDSKFEFYTYQRIMLRVNLRYRYKYSVYPRAYSKSFISVMSMMIEATLYPNSNLFVTTGGKERKIIPPGRDKVYLDRLAPCYREVA